MVNQPKIDLVIKGYPDNKIVITLVSSSSLSIKPKVVILTKNKTSAVYSITGNTSGLFNIKYKISGENAAEFDNPNSTLVFVDEANKATYAPVCYQCDGVLKRGCFSKNISNNVLVSNLQWSASKATKGITQILTYGNRTLPLSLAGGQTVPYLTTESYSGNNIIEAVNTSTFKSNCSNEGEVVLNIGSILRTNAFEYSIQVFFNTYSPSWFKLIAALKTNEYNGKDLVSELHVGSELEKKSYECITGFQFKRNNVYYIHQTNQMYNALLPNNYIELPKFSTKCIVIDMKEKNIFFGFSKSKHSNAQTIGMYRKIVNQFSTDISFLIGFEIVFSKISFEVVKSSHKVNAVGKQRHNLDFTNINVTIKTEGEMSFEYDESLNYYTKMTLAENSFVDFSFAFLLNGQTEFIRLKGTSSMINSYKKTKPQTTAKTTAEIFPVKYIFQTENLRKAFTFSKLSSISVHITYGRLALPIPLDNEVNKVNDVVKETIRFLKSFSVPTYLQSSLQMLENLVNKLSSIISSYPQNNSSLFSEIELVRLRFSEVLKRFSVLLDHYIQADTSDSKGMQIKFMNFISRYQKFIQNTHINNRQQFNAGELSYIAIESRGKLCIEFFCFRNISLKVDIMLQKVVGQFINRDDIGNYIEIPPLSKIEYNLTNKIKKAILKGRIVVFNQVKEIDVSIKESLLSFNVDTKIANSDLIPLYVEASLEAVIRDDPLYLIFSGNMDRSPKLKSDIQNSVRNYFKNLEELLSTRKDLLISLRSSAEVLFYEASNSAKLVTAKFEQLQTKLQRLDVNLTDVSNRTRFTKKKYKQSLKENANLTAARLDKLVKECQPVLCEPSCIPGYKKELCYKQRQVPLTDQHCFLQNISTVFCRHILKNKNVNVTKYKKKENCWTVTYPFVLLGAAIGTLVTGGIGGTLVGAVAGKVFGPTERHCAFHYEPFESYVVLKQYEKNCSIKQYLKSKCESKIQYINGSTESVYECLAKSSCSELKMNEVCIKSQQECNRFRKNMTVSLANKSNLNKHFRELTKTSYLYDLLMMKRNVLLQQIQSAEQELKIARVLNMSAYISYVSTGKSLKMFEITVKNDKLLIEKYKKQPTLFRSESLKFNFTYSSGMKFPENFLVEIKVFGSISTVLFSVNNYQNSVQDIALEIKDLVAEVELRKRKRRSITKPQPSQMDKKCYSIEQAEIFLLEILKMFREKLNYFTNQELFRAQQVKISERFFRKLKQNISNQFVSLVDDSTKDLLSQELNDTFLYKMKSEKKAFQTYSWNSALNEVILDMQLFVNDMQQNDCFSLLDCLHYYTNTIINKMQFEESTFSLNITEKVENLKSNILQLITAYPDLKNSRQLVVGTFNSLTEINARHGFCGSPPSLKSLLDGTIEIKAGGSLHLKVDILEQNHSYAIIWKRNNFILPKYNTTVIRKTVNIKDQGYYSCEITNKFGTTHCGTIFVKIFRNIEFSNEPQDSVQYLNSPKSTYITCAIKNNVSDEGTFTWFFRQFNATEEEKTLLPMFGQYIEISKDTALRSGFYSCLYSNKLVSAKSREATVHVLKTTVAIQRVRITMLLSKRSQTRSRREINDHLSSIKSELIKLLQIKPSQIKINNFTREDYQTDRIAFTLSGKNLTMNLENSTWDTLDEKILKEREKLLMRSISLYYHANSTSNFTVYGENYTVHETSMFIENSEPSCPEGQSLINNGFICGKSSEVIT